MHIWVIYLRYYEAPKPRSSHSDASWYQVNKDNYCIYQSGSTIVCLQINETARPHQKRAGGLKNWSDYKEKEKQLNAISCLRNKENLFKQCLNEAIDFL